MYLVKNKIRVTVCIAVLAGCKTMQPIALPQEKSLPASFTQNSDTTIPRVSYKDIFTDACLIALIDTALANNYDLKAGLQRIIMAGANLRAAKAAMLPRLDFGVNAGLDRYGKYTMNGVGNFDTNLSPNIDKDGSIPNPTPDYFAGFRSSWEADIWGKLNNRKQGAYMRYLSSQKGRQWYAAQLVAQVANMYYELVALDKQKGILRRNIALQQKGVEIIEAQMAGGRATALAVRQFKAQVLRTKGTQYQIQQAIARTENQLNNLLGRFPENVGRDTNALQINMPDKINAGLPAQVLLRRPDVQEAELNLAAAKADVQAARKAFLPSLNINAYLGLNAFKLPLLFSSGSIATGVLGGLTGPLLNRGAIKASFATANAAQLNAFYNYQKNIVQAYQEVATQLSAIQNFKNAYKLKTEEVNELKEALATANDLYLAGYATYLEVIVAQGSVLSAEMEQVDLKQQSFTALINLYRALGG